MIVLSYAATLVTDGYCSPAVSQELETGLYGR